MPEQEAQQAGDVRKKPLIGSEATKKTVLLGLADARIVHLATHAHFVLEFPLHFGINLADGILTAREVLGLHSAGGSTPVLLPVKEGMARAFGGRGR